MNTDSIAWQSGPELPKQWSGFTAAPRAGSMFVTGHDLNGSIYSFDPYHGQDEFTLESGQAPFATLEEGSAFLDDKLWLMSVGLPVGVLNAPPQRVTEIYDPLTDSWTTGPVVQNEDTLSLIHPAFVQAGGTLYAFGGRGVPGPGRSHIYDEAWKLSGDRSAWLPIAAPPVPVADPEVVAGDDGRVYLFGGVACVSPGPQAWFKSCIGGAATNLTQIYDPATGSWSQGAPMPTARYSLTAIHAGCALYAIGGLANSPLEPQAPGNPTNDVVYGPSLPTAEVYNPVDDRWIPAPALQTPRADFAAAFVGHQVWVLGGGPEPQLSSTEYLTPAVVASSVVSPAQPDGNAGWYVTQPGVTVDACNGIGGPASLVYGFDGSASGHPYTGSPQTVVVPEGVHDFVYGAFDAQHNAAVNVTRHFKIDLSPPTIAFDSFAGDAYHFAVADTGSGVSHVTVVANTPGGPVPLATLAAAPFVVPRSPLPAGTTSLTLVAYDVAGHASSAFTQPAVVPTSLAITSALVQQEGSVTVTARLLDAGGQPVAGRPVEFIAVATGATIVTGTTNAAGIASVVLPIDADAYQIHASFAGDSAYLPSSTAAATLIVSQPTQFVIWGGNDPVLSRAVRVGDEVEFWGATWSKQVRKHAPGYDAGSDFKGYANSFSGSAWQAKPGNSKPPYTNGQLGTYVPYVTVIVATRIDKGHGAIAGNVAEHAVLRVAPGKHDDHDGKPLTPGDELHGVVVAILP